MAVWVYVTCGNSGEAEKIAKAVVEERLAACANIFPRIRSFYRWKGKVQEDSEIVMILKTTRSLFPLLEERVRALHSYECPCIVALPIEAGNVSFLKWIGESVS